MSQVTPQQISDQIHSLLEDRALPFHEVLDPAMVEAAVVAEGVRFNHSRFTPFLTVCVFLSQVLDPDHACRAAVARFLVWSVLVGRKPCAPETGADCDAWQRLPLGVVARLVRKTAQEIDDRAADDWLWKGRRVVLVDGTTATMPDTPENQKVFPQSRAQGVGLGFPMVRIVVLIARATGVVRDLALGPYRGKETGETALFRTLWDGLAAGTVVLGDRSFASYFGIAGRAQRNVDALFRMHQSRKCDFRRGCRLGIRDHVVAGTKPARPPWMSQETYDQRANRLLVRELRVTIHQPGFRVNELTLVTTMLDAATYSKDDRAGLFLERGNVELDLRSIKDVLQMDVLRCKTPEMVQKEIWMHMLAYNLVRGVMAQAAAGAAILPRQLSFKGALQTMAVFQDLLRWATPSQRARLLTLLLEVIARHRVGDRFGRVEPRANKRRPKPQRYLTEPRPQARKRLLVGS